MTILEAMQSVKTHVESMWIDRCTVKTFQEETNPVTHVTSLVDTVLYSNQPCKLSHATVSVTGEGVAPDRFLTVKLFLSPLLSIPAGSTIEVVTHAGITEVYKASGAPAVYTNHQEIKLETEQNKA